jgi:hypothetical protein
MSVERSMDECIIPFMARRLGETPSNGENKGFIVTSDGRNIQVGPDAVYDIDEAEIDVDEFHILNESKTRRTVSGPEHAREQIRNTPIDDERWSN